jgi:hypothetical protein
MGSICSSNTGDNVPQQQKDKKGIAPAPTKKPSAA